jgi:predicted O-methyltransferase YrrM
MNIVPLKRLVKIIFFAFRNLNTFFISINVALHFIYVQIFIKKNYFKYKKEKRNFINECKKLKFEHGDFFNNNINSWLYIFNKFKLINKKVIVLEIGSYEGRSSYFLLKFLTKIKLTCVDTFKPFLELQDKNLKKFNKIFLNFKKNTSKYSKKLKIFKGTSHDFFKKNKYKKFDLIYIDGSHEYSYVLHDANKAFLVLKKNGILIFDDFMWENDAQKKLPFNAIIQFLKKNNNKLKILYVDYQLIIMKIKY